MVRPVMSAKGGEVKADLKSNGRPLLWIRIIGRILESI
jgi:hypothetical protein